MIGKLSRMARVFILLTLAAMILDLQPPAPVWDTTLVSFVLSAVLYVLTSVFLGDLVAHLLGIIFALTAAFLIDLQENPSALIVGTGACMLGAFILSIPLNAVLMHIAGDVLPFFPVLGWGAAFLVVVADYATGLLIPGRKLVPVKQEA